MSPGVKREYLYESGIKTLKERNARVRELTADGWTAETGGSKSYGYRVSAWMGEEPAVVKHTLGLGSGSHAVTPLYRSADGGYELANGSKER